jgi:hypothetical protein
LSGLLSCATTFTVTLVSLHLVLFWSRFPWWYNLGVVIPVVPAVLFGGKLAIALRMPNM